MKDIPGYEGLYSISEDGNVFSYRTKKFLKPRDDGRGYLKVKLTNTDGKCKTHATHRLVALTYIPNPNNLPEVDHIDRNRLNNSVDNLRWVTCKENSLNKDWEQIREKCREAYYNKPEESRKKQLRKANQASVQVRSKPIEMRDKNNHDILIKTYPSASQAAIQEFDDVKKKSHIGACARGKEKSAYGYFWTYADTFCETDV